MQNRNLFYIIITLSAIGGFFLIRNAFFEKKEIKYLENPSMNTFETFKGNTVYTDDKNNSDGIWAFSRLLEKDGYNITQVSDINDVAWDQDSTSFVVFNDYFYLQEEESREYTDRLSYDNDLFLFSNNVTLWIDYFQFLPESLTSYNSIVYPANEEHHRFNTFHEYDWGYNHRTAAFWSDEHYEYDFFYIDTLITADYYSIPFDDQMDSFNYELAECSGNSRPLMEAIYLDEGGRILVHHSPFLLTNIATESQGYFPHYKEVSSQFRFKNIVIISESEGPTTLQDSPLKYILKNPSFRWAYYLCLLTALIYMIFGGKRRQKAIPIDEPKKNTTLYYVKTLSKLYQKNNSNSAILLKMEDNFYKYTFNKYFVRKEEEDFWKKLAYKINVPKEDLFDLKEGINKYEKHLHKTDIGLYKFTSKDVTELYISLESFYKKSEKWTNNNTDQN